VGCLGYVIEGTVLGFALLSCIGMSARVEVRLGTKLVEKSDHFEVKAWGFKFDNRTEHIYCVIPKFDTAR